MNKTIYIEPHSGIAGDMFVAAMSNFFSDLNFLYKGLNSLPIKDEFAVQFKDVSKNGISAKHFNVETIRPKSHHHGRTLNEIISIINSANKITNKAKKTAVKIFEKLAEAEATVHGTVSSHVHFHEVGAIDAIVDIASAAILLDALSPDNIISTPISLGQGTIKCAHGIIPVPSPATAELIKGIPVNYTTIKSELTTPTGAAILTTISNNWEPSCSGILRKTGYGAGTKDIPNIPNILRISLIESDSINIGKKEEITVIECNIDDYPAEHLSFLGQEILNKGALDFAIIPVTMKKGRQGMILQILCPADKTSILSNLLLKETPTLGIRYRKENRIILNRKFHILDTPIGKVKIKLALDNNKNIIKAKPEQSEIVRISKEQNKSYFETYKYLDYCTQQWLLKE